MSRFVLDASVVLAWRFPDEDSSVARDVGRLLKDGNTALAPSFWPHEVLNALLVAEKRKRISAELVASFLDDLVQLPVTLQEVPAGIVFQRIRSLCRKHGLTTYDAAYLDLAIEHGLELATLDKDLARAAEAAGVQVVGR